MTPQEAVAALASTLAPMSAFSEDDIYDAMSALGMSFGVADMAYKFTQIAWARVFLDGLGVEFSPDYALLDGQGQIVEAGKLADSPWFQAAGQQAVIHQGTPGFLRMALMSAEVNAVNQALNNGSRPEDLVTAPLFLFIEAPTEEGLERARQTIAAHMASLRG